MLYNDLKHVKVGNKIEAYSTWGFENCIFPLKKLGGGGNLIISVIDGAKFAKFETPLVEGHLEGTVSQISVYRP